MPGTAGWAAESIGAPLRPGVGWIVAARLYACSRRNGGVGHSLRHNGRIHPSDTNEERFVAFADSGGQDGLAQVLVFV